MCRPSLLPQPAAAGPGAAGSRALPGAGEAQGVCCTVLHCIESVLQRTIRCRVCCSLRHRVVCVLHLKGCSVRHRVGCSALHGVCSTVLAACLALQPPRLLAGLHTPACSFLPSAARPPPCAAPAPLPLPALGNTRVPCIIFRPQPVCSHFRLCRRAACCWGMRYCCGTTGPSMWTSGSTACPTGVVVAAVGMTATLLRRRGGRVVRVPVVHGMCVLCFGVAAVVVVGGRCWCRWSAGTNIEVSLTDEQPANAALGAGA